MKGKKEILGQLAVMSALLVLLVVLFAGGYYYAGKIKGQEIILSEETTGIMQGETSEEILQSFAVLVMQCHDLDDDSLTSESENLPVEFIGFSKSDVIDYITSHKEQFQEKNEEIQNISMISFEDDALVLRKEVVHTSAVSETVKMSETEEYHYYLVLENDLLVVYKKDKTTIFLETGISVEDLTDEEREQLTRGIGIKNISELYRYLEGYTS